jgi:hypothetical protein
MAEGFEIEAIGQVLRRGGQSYECVAIKPTTRKDGTPSSFAVLRSKCVECEADFTCTSALRGAVFQPNRRCGKHKMPGVRAAGQKMKTELADLKKRLAESERARLDLAERLARYELTDEEARLFAAHCKAMTKERRARLTKARAKVKVVQGVNVFD